MQKLLDILTVSLAFIAYLAVAQIFPPTSPPLNGSVFGPGSNQSSVNGGRDRAITCENANRGINRRTDPLLSDCLNMLFYLPVNATKQRFGPFSPQSVELPFTMTYGKCMMRIELYEHRPREDLTSYSAIFMGLSNALFFCAAGDGEQKRTLASLVIGDAGNIKVSVVKAHSLSAEENGNGDDKDSGEGSLQSGGTRTNGTVLELGTEAFA